MDEILEAQGQKPWTEAELEKTSVVVKTAEGGDGLQNEAAAMLRSADGPMGAQVNSRKIYQAQPARAQGERKSESIAKYGA